MNIELRESLQSAPWRIRVSLQLFPNSLWDLSAFPSHHMKLFPLFPLPAIPGMTQLKGVRGLQGEMGNGQAEVRETLSLATREELTHGDNNFKKVLNRIFRVTEKFLGLCHVTITEQ